MYVCTGGVLFHMYKIIVVTSTTHAGKQYSVYTIQYVWYSKPLSARHAVTMAIYANWMHKGDTVHLLVHSLYGFYLLLVAYIGMVLSQRGLPSYMHNAYVYVAERALYCSLYSATSFLRHYN